MQADVTRRRLGWGPALAAFVLAVSSVVLGPAPEAHAGDPFECSLPGGDRVNDMCSKMRRGLMESAVKVAGAADSVDEAVDFAKDPLGYLEKKLRDGTKGMFSAFGQELTGKKPPDPAKGIKEEKGKGD